MKRILAAAHEIQHFMPFLPVLVWVVALALAIWMVIVLAVRAGALNSRRTAVPRCGVGLSRLWDGAL